MSILSVEKLTKHYKIRKSGKTGLGKIKGLFFPETKIINAVESVHFSIEQGESVGLIGPNGAGKSTIIKMVTGILHCTSGSINLFNVDPFVHRRHCSLNYGVVFGQRSQLWWNLSVRDSLSVLRKIYYCETKSAQKKIEMLAELFELNDFIDTPVRQLSLGQRARANIAASMIHEPKILFLDEPTIGVDVLGKTRIREYIHRINAEYKVTVILTSHDMFDVAKLSRRVIVLDKGRIVYDGLLSSLVATIHTESRLDVDCLHPLVNTELKTARILEQNKNHLTLAFDTHKYRPIHIIKELSADNEILDFKVHETPIDELIAQLYKQQACLPQEDSSGS